MMTTVRTFSVRLLISIAGCSNRWRLRIGPFGCDDDGLRLFRGEHRDFGLLVHESSAARNCTAVNLKRPRSMDVSDFNFDLPDRLIAQEAAPRGTSRLLVLDRSSGALQHSSIAEFPSFLSPGDLLVVNNTRVFAARLLGSPRPERRRRRVLPARPCHAHGTETLADRGSLAPDFRLKAEATSSPEHAGTPGTPGTPGTLGTSGTPGTPGTSGPFPR